MTEEPAAPPELQAQERQSGTLPGELQRLRLPQSPLSPAQVQQLSPSALAYLGDTVYELWVRMAYIFPPKRSHTYHQQVVSQVRAETQAQHLETLLPDLTPTEQDILRRGRNAAFGGPKRLDPDLYQKASSLETLIGYLYLTNPDRLFELLAQLPMTGQI